jgi:hypothetical protein
MFRLLSPTDVMVDRGQVAAQARLEFVPLRHLQLVGCNNSG